MAVYEKALTHREIIRNLYAGLSNSQEEAPQSPSNLRAYINNDEIILNWDDNSTDELGFVIEYNITGVETDFVPIEYVDKNITLATITNQSANNEYYIRVRAYNFGKFSEYSEIVNHQVQNASKKIMLVGNSITAGIGSSDGLGFRQKFYDLLAGAGEYFNFVGTTASSPYKGYFFPGKNIEHFYPSYFGNGSGNGLYDITNVMNQENPEVILIHLGTNDLTDETMISPYSADDGQTMLPTTTGEMAELIRYLLQWKNGVNGTSLQYILVSKIVPREIRMSEVQEFNAELQFLVDDFKNGQISGIPEPVHIVDHYTPFISNPDLFSGNLNDFMAEHTHPNDKGYTQMAKTYFFAYETIVNNKPENEFIFAKRKIDDNHSYTNEEIPKNFALMQNYPNPFSLNSALSSEFTWIKYQIPEDQNVKIYIYNMLGRKVKTLVSNHKYAGYYQVPWNGRSDNGNFVSSGIYFCVMQSNNYVKHIRIVITK